MKRLVIAAVVVFGMCLAAAGVAAGPNRNYVAHLSGDEEVPPRDTRAQGQAIFHLSKDGTVLSYKLIATNIDNVFGAHIHSGARGVNGPIVVGLFAGPVAGGHHTGILAQGEVPATAALIALLDSGNAYVNVHTNDGVAPANTGPGDFPGGEIRGQVR